MNNVAKHSRVPSQTKDHKTATLWCILKSRSLCNLFLFFISIAPCLVLRTLNPTLSMLISVQLIFPLHFLYLQALRPSRPSGLSLGTSLCEWEPQLCWGVRCCGPQGLCNGQKMVSSWDLREICQAFHATAWLEIPTEVHRDTPGLCYIADWA